MITRDPKICGGQPCIGRTRIPVAVIVRALAANSAAEVAAELGLSVERVCEAAEYAARLCEVTP